MTLTLASVGAIAVLILANLFTLNRWMGERDDYRDFRTRVAQAQAEAEDVARLRAEREQRILEDTARGWAHAVDWHRAHSRIVRVQQPASGCLRPVPELSAAAGGLAQTTPEHGLDPEFHAALAISCAECDERLNRSIEASAMVLHLQDFLLRQHEASQ